MNVNGADTLVSEERAHIMNFAAQYKGELRVTLKM